MINLRTTLLKYVMLVVITFYTGMSAADDTVLSVSADRTWGLLLGDELAISADLSALDEEIDSSSLPQSEQRYGTWLYLRNIDKTADNLVFHYQVVNVPTKNTAIDTPKFDVKLKNEKWFIVPATSITIGPALAASTGGVSNLLPKSDIKPTLISTVEAKKQLKLFSTLAVISGLILALWHFGWKTKNRQPFAQAVHDLSRLSFHSVTPDQAARILHTAFNHTSGTVVVYGELDNLLKQYSWLAPLQQDIELFYEQSRAHFFARNAQQGPDIEAVRKLAKACRSKEMLA